MMPRKNTMRLDVPTFLRSGERLEDVEIDRYRQRVGVSAHGVVPSNGSALRSVKLDGSDCRVGSTAKSHAVPIGGLGAPDLNAPTDRVELNVVHLNGWQHGGVYVGHRAVVEAARISGEGCGFGEVCQAGAGSRLMLRKSDVHHINVEVSAAAEPSHTTVVSSRCSQLGVEHAHAGSTVRLDRVEVLERATLHSARWLEADRLIAAEVDIIQPGHTRLSRGRIGSLTCRFQAGSRRQLNQRLTLNSTTVRDPIVVSGVGELHLIGDFESEPVIAGVASNLTNRDTAVAVYRDGERIGTLEAGDVLTF